MITFWRTCFLTFLGIINIVLFYRMVWGGNGVLAFNELRKDYNALEMQIKVVDAQNLQLSRDIRLLKSDNAYVEKMVRQRLHYVRKNEILYLFTEKEQKPKQGVRNAGKN